MIVQKKFAPFDKRNKNKLSLSPRESCTTGGDDEEKRNERLNQSKIHILHVFQFSISGLKRSKGERINHSFLSHSLHAQLKETNRAKFHLKIDFWKTKHHLTRVKSWLEFRPHSQSSDRILKCSCVCFALSRLRSFNIYFWV